MTHRPPLPILLALALLLPAAPAPAQVPTPDDAPPNYAHAPAMHSLLHWPRFPLHVYLAPGPAATPAVQKAALAGFSEWVQATGGVVHYETVTASAQADLTVTFLSDTFLPKQPGVMGTTSIMYSRDILSKATMQIATGDATPEQIQTCAAHEFGHALGINGHSPNPGDLMYPSETRVIAFDGTPVETPPRLVSSRDLNTLKIAYGPLWAKLASRLPPIVPRQP